MPSPIDAAPPLRRARAAALLAGPALAALALTPALFAAGHAGAQDARRAERRVLRGREVAIWNVAGRVRVERGFGDDVVVEVARGGRDGARLRLAGDAASLQVIFPDDRIVYPGWRRDGRVHVRTDASGRFLSGSTGWRLGRGGVEVRGSGSGTEAWADLVVRVPAGRRVAVHLAAGVAEAHDLDADLTLDVYAADVMTDGTRGRLLIDAGSGAIRVRGAEGEVRLDTGSGAVEVERVRATQLAVDAGSGAVRGADVTADEVELDLGSGAVRLDALRAPRLHVDAGSGSVELDLAADVDDVRIDSGSGEVTLRLSPSLGAEVDIDTGSGGIVADVPLRVTARERGHLAGVLGDGRGRITVDGGSGRVHLVPR